MDPARSETPRSDALSPAERDARIEQLLLAGLDHYFAHDYEQAIKLGTNFPDEARAGTAGPPPQAQGGDKKQEPEKSTGGIAAQVVAKGVFAGKPPTGVSDVAWRGVLQRRGAEDFRQKVLSAYGSKCAVTSADAEAKAKVGVPARAVIGDGVGAVVRRGCRGHGGRR